MKQGLIEDRIARAQADLAAYLALANLSRAVIGSFEVTLTDGQLQISRIVSDNGLRQRELPFPITGNDQGAAGTSRPMVPDEEQ